MDRHDPLGEAQTVRDESAEARAIGAAIPTGRKQLAPHVQVRAGA